VEAPAEATPCSPAVMPVLAATPGTRRPSGGPGSGPGQPGPWRPGSTPRPPSGSRPPGPVRPGWCAPGRSRHRRPAPHRPAAAGPVARTPRPGQSGRVSAPCAWTRRAASAAHSVGRYSSRSTSAGAQMLALHSRGLGALLEEPGLIHHQHPARPGLFGQLPAVLARNVAQQAGHEAGSPPADPRPGEPRADPLQQLVELRCPALDLRQHPRHPPALHPQQRAGRLPDQKCGCSTRPNQAALIRIPARTPPGRPT
jgi:hypothetical protein